ncbi:hypothetical protein ACERK3_02200 [Phycisphaerales bacterium AB-hyl4]|uniref:Uncharacterized protein n=1 Tax=Natronomicrosphaera hydrolytica TaxID=3242702 RepID=A0ABV4U151_9BACT
MEKPQETPLCISIVVCDAIYRDARTNNLVMAGAFNEIRATAFPACHPKMCVVFTVTNGRGKNEVALTVEHEESGVQIVEIRGPIVLDNPLQIADFDIELRGVVFPKPGKYWIAVSANGELLAHRPILLKLVEPKVKKEDKGNA